MHATCTVNDSAIGDKETRSNEWLTGSCADKLFCHNLLLRSPMSSLWGLLGMLPKSMPQQGLDQIGAGWPILSKAFKNNCKTLATLPKTSPGQAPSLKPQAPKLKKQKKENTQKWKTNFREIWQKSTKNHENSKNLKNTKPEIKVSKSLANPNTNPKWKQILWTCKENHQKSKKSHFAKSEP